MTKLELVQSLLTEEEQRKIDFALPQGWVDQVDALQVDYRFYVWSYIENRIFGKPLNLAEKFITEMEDE